MARNMTEWPVRKLDLVLTCTGRTASAAYSRYVTAAGLACGHEQIFLYGGYDTAVKRLGRVNDKGQIIGGRRAHLKADSSWMAAPLLDTDLLESAFVVHLIRHPKATIESWMKEPTESAPGYYYYAAEHCPGMLDLEYPLDRYACRYIEWNRMIERKLKDRDHIRFDIAGDPIDLIKMLHERGTVPNIPIGHKVFNDKRINYHGSAKMSFLPSMIHDDDTRDRLIRIASDYGYEWPDSPVCVSTPVVKAVITSLDNRDILKRQVAVLRSEPLDEIVVVNNGSVDGTREWLNEQVDLTVVHRENHGAGPGRNAGLDAAGEFDYVLMLDGGILVASQSVDKMLTYLVPRPGYSGVGVEIEDLRTDAHSAWTRWTEHISRTYTNYCLSHTAYGMFTKDSWDEFRFCEEGPFGMPGWGGDDNEMMYQWLDAGKVIRVVTCGCKLPYFGEKDGVPGRCVGGSIHAYRRQGGSWARIKRETGLEPWAEGSVYEQRCIWLKHRWPQYDLGDQRGEPWMTMVVKAADTIEETAAMIKLAHRLLYRRKMFKPRPDIPRPYSIILWLNDADESTVRWARDHHLRRHFGTTIVADGEIVRRSTENEKTWTGDFRLCYEDDWRESLRPNSYYFGFCKSADDVESIVGQYERIFPTGNRMPSMQPKHRLREIKVG